MHTLSLEEIHVHLNALDGWTLDGAAIRKDYLFAGFLDAVRFVDRLAPLAEAADHHPDILISYRRVTLTYTTHSARSLTLKDFAGAAMADGLT